MTDFRAEQSNFTFGQIDPRLQARTDYEGYYKGASDLTNCIVLPQGGITRRFGTQEIYSLEPFVTNPAFVEFTDLLTADGATYVLVFTNNLILIFLGNTPSAFANPISVVSTYAAEDVQSLKFTQVQDRLIIVHPYYPPAQLQRSAVAGTNITGFSGANNTLTIALAGTYSKNLVLPVQFTGGPVPTTVPQIHTNRTYFARFITATTFQIYSTADEALEANISFTTPTPYTITNAGVGAQAIFLTQWTLSNIAFIYEPTYDFGLLSYAATTFTPSAVSGAITLTASVNPTFTAAMAANGGGLFAGNGGIMRITGFTDATHVTGFTIISFNNTNAILGSLSFLGEPAWSATRFYPQTASFVQNRLVFGGSPSIPNGVWLSTPNEVFNFDDSELLPDNAISWYPSSNQGGNTVALTAASSLIVHTTTGTFSSPVFTEQPLTPTNFVLTENTKDGVTGIQPVFIDNQVLYIDSTGQNVKNLIWEFAQSKYVLNNSSVPSSNLIKSPVDMAAFVDPTVAEGYFIIVVNGDGTLALLQTLKAENIRAWTPQVTHSSFNDGFTFTQDNFIRVTSKGDWCWFIVQRFHYIVNTTTAITGFVGANNTFTAAGHNIPLATPSLIQFTLGGGGVIPVTNPQINLTQYFWAIATDANHFQVYANYEDAVNLQNVFVITNAGINANVVYWSQSYTLNLETVNFNIFVDHAVILPNLAAASIGAFSTMNGNYLSIIEDGYVYPDAQVFNNVLTLPVVGTQVVVGLPFTSNFSPLPYANLPNGIGIYQPKHIKSFYCYYYQSLGFTIQGFDVPVPSNQQVLPGNIQPPVTAVYYMGLMEDWDPFSYTINITQSKPLPMTILGIGYILEV